MSKIEDLSDGDSVIITYFNTTSGKMREKSLKVTEVDNEFIYLEEAIGPSEYRYLPEEEELEMLRDDSWTLLGNDCMVDTNN